MRRSCHASRPAVMTMMASAAVLLAVLCCCTGASGSEPAANQPLIQADAHGNLHINSTNGSAAQGASAMTTVYMNGRDVPTELRTLLDKTRNLQAQQRLLSSVVDRIEQATLNNHTAASPPESQICSNVTFARERVITSSAIAASLAFAVDFDSDGHLDVLGVSSTDDMVAWFANSGNGSFSAASIVTENADFPLSACAADFDGDGDLDVATSSFFDDKIAWFQNPENSVNSPWQEKPVATSVGTAQTVFAADVDGDEDVDLLIASNGASKISWFENTDGAGSFSAEKAIATSASMARSVYAADLDGDGDMDVIGAIFGANAIVWYENEGGDDPSFSQGRDITTNASGAYHVIAADVDGDGDMDVVSASLTDNKIAWYKNTDGEGSFSEQNIITTSATQARAVFAADVDGDGDMDVLSASFSDNTIAWYENTNGEGSFSSARNITTTANGASSVYAADLDGDGDVDVLSTSRSDNTISWFENLCIN